MGQPLEQADADIDMQHLRDNLRPAVQEIDPAVFNVELAGGLLRARMLEEDEVATIVELPHQSTFRKERRSIVNSRSPFLTISPSLK